MPIDQTDLLRQAGYNEEETLTRTIPLLINIGPVAVTAGSFTPVSDGVYYDFSSVPTDATVTVRMVGETGATMDTDGDFDIGVNPRQGGSNTATPTVTLSSGQDFESFTSPTVEVGDLERTKLRPRVRSNGTDTVELFMGSAQIEVTL